MWYGLRVRWFLLLVLLAACAPRVAPAPAAATVARSPLDGAWRVVRFRCHHHPLHQEAGILAAVLVSGVVGIELAGDRFRETIAGKAQADAVLTRSGTGFRVSPAKGTPRGFFVGAVARPDGRGGWLLDAADCESWLRRPGEAAALPALCLGPDSRVLERRPVCASGERLLDPRSWGLR